MRYKAFISYSHSDTPMVIWFHRKLERWRIPADLIGKETSYGAVPKTLSPVFRDRDDFAGGSSLQEATLAALTESEFLIVFCSPAAAGSPYVNEEVRAFKAMGRSHRVIPVIIGGEPGHAELDCFPPAVKFQVDEQGLISPKPESPIAPDAREVGDGKYRALAKVVAGLLEMPFDEIIRRETRARRNRVAVLSGVGCGAFLFATGLSSLALYKNYQAEVTIDKSVFALGGVIQEADRLSEDNVNLSRKLMLRKLCDLMEGLAGDSDRIGLFEKTICVCEQARAVFEIGDRDEAITGLKEWIAKLESEGNPGGEEMPFDQAAAVVKTARELSLFQIELEPDKKKIDGILRNLVEQVEKVAEFRPDIIYLRDVHEEVVWPLIELLEEKQAFDESLGIMLRTAELRQQQYQNEDDQSALIQGATFLRRSAWLCGTRLDDHSRALELAQRAVDAFSEVPDDENLLYEKVLAYEVLGNARKVNQEKPLAIAAYQKALDLIAVAVDGADNEEWITSFKGEETLIRKQLKELAP